MDHFFQNRGRLISLNTTGLDAHEGKNGSWEIWNVQLATLIYKHCIYLSLERNILEQMTADRSHFNLLFCLAASEQKEQNINLNTEVENDWRKGQMVELIIFLEF